MWRMQWYSLVISIHEITNLLQRRYDTVSADLQLAFSRDNRNIEDIKGNVSRLKMLLETLYTIVALFNSLFGKYLVYILSNSFMQHLLVLDQAMSESFRFIDRWFLLGSYIFYGIFTVVTIMSCDKLEKSGLKVLETCHYLQTTVEDDFARKELASLADFVKALLPTIFTVVAIMSCDKLEKSGLKVLETCHYLQTTVEDDFARKELANLADFIKALLPTISAAGFFKINQRLLPAFLSALTSYVIIIIQFEM
ncbi:unnamed protein product [Phaedon cochleariae]|uniref:Gustatory receptor n=1 Tax=Phaedon cochleariae TaxID=80249 RepID=A0A9P0DPF8_PHACE|nr:unnamed protein product [Phaedon cochleariae]